MHRAVFIALLFGVIADGQHFPPLDRDHPSKTRIIRHDSYCMNASKAIAENSAPLFSFDFVSPGASGVVRIDGKAVSVFRNEQRLRVHAMLTAGQHRFDLILDRPAVLTFMSSHDDFRYCHG